MWVKSTASGNGRPRDPFRAGSGPSRRHETGLRQPSSISALSQVSQFGKVVKLRVDARDDRLLPRV